MNFKSNIKRIRLEDNLSIKEFAIKLDVSENSIRNWEAGVTRPSVDSIVKIKNHLGIDYEDLID